ncbi:MAG: geranylgeranyl reductase family protein [Halodesulfurarchaeum sp.]
MADIAVVGLGPPGARFARQAAERGYSVLGLERGAVGRPLACSGHVSRDIWNYLPENARTELLQNEIRGARFRLGGPDATPYPFYKHEPISNVIDRVSLDRTLVDRARDAGATIQTGVVVTGVEENRDGIRLTVRDGRDERIVDAKLVVGADGPDSIVRRELGLPEPSEFVSGVLVYVDEPDDGSFVDVHLTVPTFFAWRIPRGKAGVEFGLGAPPDVDAFDELSRLLSQYGVEPDRRFAGKIPIGPPDRVTTRRGLLLGDAAGQTKPFTGGGILYGLRAADIAASVVDPDHPETVSEYERAWRDELGREIALGSIIRRGYSLPKSIQRAGLRFLSGEIGVHMDEPTSLFSRDQLRALFR